MAATDKKELWVQWTRDAAKRYVMPDEIESADDLVDDMVEITTKYADTMLDEFEAREEDRAFGGSRGGGGGGSGGRRKRKPQEEGREGED